MIKHRKSGLIQLGTIPGGFRMKDGHYEGDIDMVREARNEDLDALLKLYLFLHEDSIPELNAHLKKTWDQIIEDPNHHLIVKEVDGQIVSSCVCVIIPNLTRNVRPYAFVENVVTHADYRGNGYAGECLDFARKIAKQENCYKMMLLTGSKKPETLHFYEKAGYNSSDKTAFIQWIGMTPPFIPSSCKSLHSHLLSESQNLLVNTLAR